MGQPIFDYNETTATATCCLEFDGQVFVGTAQAHPDDMDMASKLVGQDIAYRRAMIKYLSFVRDYQIKPELRALERLYYTMAHSTHYNSKSYESKMLRRQLRQLESDLATIKEEIANERQELKDLIAEKDNFYKQIRVIRQKAKNN